MNTNRKGTPSLLDRDVIEDICKFLRAGNTRRTACALSGVRTVTFDSWMLRATKDRSNQSDSLYVLLVEKMNAAESAWESHAVGLIGSHGEKDWKAISWLLARRNRADWGDEKKAAPVPAPAEVSITVVGPETA